jgi:diguanylate cyclase (GGDEF)-like protein/PAS domain S-box-containing protein
MYTPKLSRSPTNRSGSMPRITPGVLVGVVLGSLLLLLAVLTLLRVYAMQASERETASLALLIEEKVERIVQVVDLTLLDVAGDIRNNRQRPYFDAEWMHELLRARLLRMPYVRAIWVLDPRGRIIYDSDTGNLGYDLSDRDYFTAHQRRNDTGLFIGNPVISRSVGEWFVSLSRAQRAVDGTLENVIVAAFNSRYFAELWQGVDVGEHGSIAVLSSDGTLMLRSPSVPEMMHKSFADTSAFKEYLPRLSAFTYTGHSVVDGVERIMSFRVVHDYPRLIVFTGLSVNEALAQWRRFSAISVGAWLTAMLVLGALTHFLARALQGRHFAEQQVDALARFPLEDPSPILRIGADGAIQYANPPAMALRTTVLAETGGESRAQWKALIDSAIRSAPGAMLEADLAGKSYAFTAAPVTQAGYVNLYATDVTELKRVQRALEETLHLFHQLAAKIPEAFWVSEVGSDQLLYSSPGWETITGRSPPGDCRELFDVLHPDDRDAAKAMIKPTAPAAVDHEFRIQRTDGATRWVRVQTFDIQNEAGEVYRTAGVAEDITERKAVEERLLEMAQSDALTRLPNRKLFHDSLVIALEHAKEHGWTLGIVFIDLDRFKVVNDTLGHATGDELLQKVASRLTDCVRVRDVVGRLGGDEFGVLLRLDDADDARLVAVKILHALMKPFDLDGRETFITASIGITIYPTDATDPGTLLRYADTAMYRAKDDGRNTFRYFTAEMNARAAERLDLETDLRRALAQHEFVLVYQPKLDLRTRAISGAEALLRWARPGVGLLVPAQFIQLLEETGLIVPVGEWVIGEACRQLGAWDEEGVPGVPIAVNLSARQFRHENLTGRITEAVVEHCTRSELLEIEITESLLMSTVERTAGVLEVLRAGGTKIAIDDFGTGYSSLSYLKRFPLDAIKIDQSFVRDLTIDADDAAIVLAIISMAHQLGLRVIAEGVETEEQLRFLEANECDEIQGHVFSRPISALGMTALLRRHKPTAVS